MATLNDHDWCAICIGILTHLNSYIFRQCTEALGGRDFREVQQLVKAGTLTEEDLRSVINLTLFNSVAFRKTKTLWSFGLS